MNIFKNKESVFIKPVQHFLKTVGGKENIKQAHHCATRFRFLLHDENKVNLNDLKNTPMAKGYNKSGDEHQLILGAGVVNKFYRDYQILTEEKNSTTLSDQNAPVKQKWWDPKLNFKNNFLLSLQRIVRNFADIFIPIIPLFIVGGMSLAFGNLINVEGVGKLKGEFVNDAAAIFSKLFDIVGGAVFGFLPAIVGYSFMKKLGGNPYYGLIIGLCLVAPAIANGYDLKNEGGVFYTPLLNPAATPEKAKTIYTLWDLNHIRVFDFPFLSGPLLGYQAQIVPVLLVVYLAYWIERFFKRYSPEALAILLIPIGTVLVTVSIAFIILGPLGYVLSFAIGQFFRLILIYTNFPYFGIGSAFFGFVWAPLVVTGLHQGFLAIEAQSVAQFGITYITPLAAASNIAQGVACLMGVIYIKQKQMRSVGISAGITANLGITEPSMFGMNLRVKPLFFAAIIGSAVGGFYIGMTQTVASSFGSASWLGLIQFSSSLKSAEIVKWYQFIQQTVPWEMNHFNLPPIANMAIAASLTTFTVIVLSYVFTQWKVTKKMFFSLFKEINHEQTEVAPNLFKLFAKKSLRTIKLPKKQE